MTTEDITEGWWRAPAATAWICPECKRPSPVADWPETEAACDDCGSHDARECPICREVFDHVWGSGQIADANPPALNPPEPEPIPAWTETKRTEQPFGMVYVWEERERPDQGCDWREQRVRVEMRKS